MTIASNEKERVSAIDITILKAAAERSIKCYQDVSKMKESKINMRKKQLNEKFNEMTTKYFNDNWYYGIPQSLLRACGRASDEGNIKLYMNFERKDFCNWNRFVPYEADEYGKNLNARPANCLKIWLQHCKDNGLLSDNISFNVWGNKKFTVLFNVTFTTETNSETENIESSIS